MSLLPTFHVQFAERDTQHCINSFYDSHKTSIISVFLRRLERRRGRRGQRKRGTDCIRTISMLYAHCVMDVTSHLFVDSPNVDAAGGIVHTPVTGETPAIFEEILKRRNSQNEQDGDHSDFLAECIYSRYPIEQNNENEVQISHAVKLFQEITR